MEDNKQYKFAGIIPARYASSRFPGKPLAIIGNKPMIQRVYEQASKSLDIIYVATDDKRIYDTVIAFGGKAVMTATTHMSGTDRCAEAVDIINSGNDSQIEIAVNIQGDEPFIRPEQIDLIKKCFTDKTVEIATLVRIARQGEDIFNINQPKVILNKAGDAIYFSRAAIPFYRDAAKEEWTRNHLYYKHIGLYAYRTSTLHEITKLERSPLELCESLEQNRWIENGYKIRTAITEWESIGIDVPEDIEKAKELLDQFN